MHEVVRTLLRTKPYRRLAWLQYSAYAIRDGDQDQNKRESSSLKRGMNVRNTLNVHHRRIPLPSSTRDDSLVVSAWHCIWSIVQHNDDEHVSTHTLLGPQVSHRSSCAYARFRLSSSAHLTRESSSTCATLLGGSIPYVQAAGCSLCPIPKRTAFKLCYGRPMNAKRALSLFDGQKQHNQDSLCC